MTDEMDGKDLAERVRLIESMMAEGRQRTARWGWTFVLWGVAYLVATAWSSGLVGGPVWAQHLLAWPVTMIAASIATGVTISRMKKGQPPTTLGRAIGAIWAAMGISLFIVLMSLGLSGRYDTACVRGHHRRDAGRGQYGLGHHSEVEDAVCLRGGVAGVGCGWRVLARITRPGLRFLQLRSSARLFSASTPCSWNRSAANRTGWCMPELPELNPVIHGKLRLALLSLLSGVDEAEFTWLRGKTGSTDGNLGAQLTKLEEAGYVTVEKRFVMRKPQTLYRMTDAGRAALTEYVAALKQLLGTAI